jgi:phosphoadenosine phosphosulfate reductase
MQLQELELIRSVLETGQGRPCVTCSFQVEGVVLLHMMRQVRPDIDVLFVDTGYHFPETYAYRDRLARDWNLNLINLKPELPVEAHEAQFGKMYQEQPDRCCKLRKVGPLLSVLEDYDLWFTGLRRDQSPTRAKLGFFGQHKLPGGKIIRKICPLALWSWKDVWSYVTVNEIDHLPLYERGYLSIGCQPCTSLPTDFSNPRSGRWAGKKLECGIHTFDREV